MTQDSDEILHVSDTALMVAACRALETERSDGLVRDPFASTLAGERGMAIARNLPFLPMMCFGIGMRSRFLDGLVLDALALEGIETVLSLGAGLDSRPWRLDLPETLRWIEVDFPEMLEYKARILCAATPKCRLERLSADLNDSAQRKMVFNTVGDAPALMITEGLLMYLPAATVDALANESKELSGTHYWLMDLQSPALDSMVSMQSFQSIEKVRASDRLDGLQMMERLKQAGWSPLRCRSYVRDVNFMTPQRIQELSSLRAPGQPPPVQPPHGDISGVHLFHYPLAGDKVDRIQRCS